MQWNCGGGFHLKLRALLASCGDADIIIITETHLPAGCIVPDLPGYRTWLLSREGAKRSSGGIAVLVHERMAEYVQPWQPMTSKQSAPSPYHLWFRIEAASGLPRPIFLAAGYLPPYGSKYALSSQQQLEEFFAMLGDEVAEAAAVQGGADLALCGDWNGHLGQLQESGESCAALLHALGSEAEDVLMPCASNCPAVPIPTRASSCSAPVCEQGRALVQFCSATGLLVMNGRLPGDELGSPTCFAGSPSTIDLFLGSPGLLQGSRLRVLGPVPEYVQHRPVELLLALAKHPVGAHPGSVHHDPTSPQQP